MLVLADHPAPVAFLGLEDQVEEVRPMGLAVAGKRLHLPLDILEDKTGGVDLAMGEGAGHPAKLAPVLENEPEGNIKIGQKADRLLPPNIQYFGNLPRLQVVQG